MAAGAGQCVPTMSYTNQKAMYDGVKKERTGDRGGIERLLLHFVGGGGQQSVASPFVGSGRELLTD